MAWMTRSSPLVGGSKPSGYVNIPETGASALRVSVMQHIQERRARRTRYPPGNG